jgi:two-component system cell cycle sensor histidine kinase/response regulator CckA
MEAPLHILHLEDDPDDAVLVAAALKAEGVDFVTTRVQRRVEFEAALESGGIDLVLSDFSLPGFDGMTAIQIVRERWPDLPVILVSGTLGEEQAIEALKSGATDYVLKERLARLAPALRRAMREVADHAARRRLEDQFIESQKMEVIGQLAGGVAHDFNNILAVIMGCIDIITLRLGPDHSLERYTDEIGNAAKRAAALTRQLLLIGSKGIVQPTILDPNAVVRDMDSILRRLIDEGIALTIVPGADVGSVKADAGYLGQVLMNLVVNARDAMSGGGTITISTSNVRRDREYVVLSVRDTGTGITEDVRAHLFEPFYTTKPKGQGTGLGLAICDTIVKQSGGHIELITRPGEGSAFEVFLPRVESPVGIADPPMKDLPSPRGTETLMVVEDEPSVRHLARDVLEAQGYTVLSASNGQHALQLARDHLGAPICLAVTDVIMPVMGGKVMAEWLKMTCPAMKILFTSGYTDDTLTGHGENAAEVEFLAKPYTPAALTRRVRDLLDRVD